MMTLRWELFAVSAGVSAFLMAFNLLYVAMRFVGRRRVSSVPLLGSMFGIIALIAIPVSVSWELVLTILAGFLVTEFLNFLWPASL